VEASLRRHEHAGTTDDPEYAAAGEVFTTATFAGSIPVPGDRRQRTSAL